jgi:hypothetical protein
MYLEMQQSHGLKAFLICFENRRNSLKMLLFQFTFKNRAEFLKYLLLNRPLKTGYLE